MITFNNKIKKPRTSFRRWFEDEADEENFQNDSSRKSSINDDEDEYFQWYMYHTGYDDMEDDSRY